MSSPVEIVRRLGKLAQLSLTPDEEIRFGGQLQEIISYFQSLKGLDLVGIEPTAHVVEIECYRRTDEPGERWNLDPVLAGRLRHGYFPVPRIIAESADAEISTPAVPQDEE